MAKGNRIEIYLLCPHGHHVLHKPLLDIPIYGRIVVLESFRPQGEAQDSLFIATERYKFCVLQWDANSSELITRKMGDLSVHMGQPTNKSQIGIIDPDYRLIGLHLYRGFLKVIPVDNKELLNKEFDIKLEESDVLDLKFLCGCTKPTIAVLYEDQEGRHVNTYRVSLDQKKFTDGPWTRKNLNNGAYLLIPVSSPLSGALVVAKHTIAYCSASAFEEIPITHAIIETYGRVDESRFLLGDVAGLIHLCVITHKEETFTGLEIDFLGITSIASTISQLDNALFFVGSSCGDSQLIKLKLSSDEKSFSVEILESYVNLGPVSDFCVVDHESQVVTCSGAFNNGSLRIIRNWRGFIEQGSETFEVIKGMWSLKSSTDDAFVTLLVLGFIGEIRILAINPEGELTETEINGFSSQVDTLFCHDAVYNQLIQVTSNSVRLVSSTAGRALLTEWLPSSEITIATANICQVLLTTKSRTLEYLEIGDGTLTRVSQTQLMSAPSCLNINPIGDNPNYSQLASVGTWIENNVKIFSLPELAFITEEKLEFVPRSVLFCAFEGISYLLCGLGDGHLINFQLDATARKLRIRRKVSLGARPINLGIFATYVFAASDRPTVIYSSQRELQYKNVNMREARHMCPFNSAEFPNRLAIAREDELTIGSIDDIQKLYIRTVPLEGHARCICHQEQTQTFGICLWRDGFGASFSLLGEDFTFLGTYYLEPREQGCSILSCSFTDDQVAYYCVGTGYFQPGESESDNGRILVFQADKGQVLLTAQMRTTGGVYSLNSFNGKLLAATNQSIHLYKWMRRYGGSRKLQFECGYDRNKLARCVQTRGDLIVVGDVAKSLSLLIYKHKEGAGAIELLARDYNAKSMVAVELLDDDIYLGAESSLNLFTVRKNSKGATAEEQGRLEVVGKYHLGELVTRFHPDMEIGQIPAILFGTTNGVIGRVASVPEEQYEFLEKLQSVLRRVTPGVGILGREDWRSFSLDQRTAGTLNILDGDLIESLLHLSPNNMKDVSRQLDIQVLDLCKRVERLTRLDTSGWEFKRLEEVRPQPSIHKFSRVAFHASKRGRK